MKLYLIGGLGADERVFRFLKIDCEVEVLKWLKPIQGETISAYAKRLLVQVNQNQDYGFLGVSFGGMVAMELAKISRPRKLILISSVAVANQLPRIIRIFGKSGMLNLIPNLFIKPPSILSVFLFGAKNKKLLTEIIDDTDPVFIRWALNVIVHWSNDSNEIIPIRIHGSRDRLIPLKGNSIVLKEGGHFMIVDKAQEISKLVNNQLKV